jgi:hypothetical protein
MFKTEKARLERRLTNIVSRLQKLDEQIKAMPAYHERQLRWNRELHGLSEPEREAWLNRRQMEHDRERLMNLEMLELAAPQGEKTREYVELLRHERQRDELQAQKEWLDVQLDRISNARQEAVWFWLGFALTFAVAFALLHLFFKLPLWAALALAYWSTALLSQLQHIQRLTRRTLDVLVYEAAQRVSAEQKISLARAQRQIEEWRWV